MTSSFKKYELDVEPATDADDATDWFCSGKELDAEVGATEFVTTFGVATKGSLENENVMRFVLYPRIRLLCF